MLTVKKKRRGRLKRNRFLEQKIAACKADIFTLCRELRIEPTFQQELLFCCVQRGDRQIACKSGQGPGKTTSTAVIALWLLLQKPDTLIVVTAPTVRQCREIWLGEFRRVVKRAAKWLRRFVTVTKSRVVLAKHPNWGVVLFTATNPEAAAGWHQEELSVIVEEASGVAREIITTLEGTLSNPNSLLLLIGNPNTRDCKFFDCFNALKKHWTTLTFNAEETPASAWFDPSRNEAIAEEYGRESDVYRVRVKGEFPHTDPSCVISDEVLWDIARDEKLFYKCVMARTEEGVHVRGFGIDFARFGGNESAGFRRAGNALVAWERLIRREPVEILRWAFAQQASAGWRNEDCWYNCDAGGIGQGVLHVPYEAEKRVFEFHFGGKAFASQEYENRATEAWFSFARRAKAREIWIPPDMMLIRQLSTRQYYMTSKNKVVIETKDEYMKRGAGEESPDRADACVLAFYDEPWTGNWGDWNPVERKAQNPEEALFREVA